jgi:NAD(P)-dependent dehydrogenase (short-subunit alcohol dehydrogenase family)
MGVLDSYRLNGRVSVVTGANRGIGRSLAVALAEAGSDLALVVRSPEGCGELIEELTGLGVRARAFAADVTDEGAVEQAATDVVGAFGRVDALINNAGTCIHRPAFEVTAQEWHQVIETNLTGVWNCSRAFGRRMADGDGGSIVNIGSISAIIVNRPQWQPAYNASKAAVHQLTKSLAAEWAPLRAGSTRSPPGTSRPRWPRWTARSSAGTGSRTPRCSATPLPRSWGRRWSTWPVTRRPS